MDSENFWGPVEISTAVEYSTKVAKFQKKPKSIDFYHFWVSKIDFKNSFMTILKIIFGWFHHVWKVLFLIWGLYLTLRVLCGMIILVFDAVVRENSQNTWFFQFFMIFLWDFWMYLRSGEFLLKWVSKRTFTDNLSKSILSDAPIVPYRILRVIRQPWTHF